VPLERSASSAASAGSPRPIGAWCS
jgi:hypothetical protein